MIYLCCGPDSILAASLRTTEIYDWSLSFWMQILVKHQKSLLNVNEQYLFQSLFSREDSLHNT